MLIGLLWGLIEYIVAAIAGASLYKEKADLRCHRSLAIINCSQLVTLAGPTRPRIEAEMSDLSIINDGALFVHDSRIEKVGTRGTRLAHSLIRHTAVVDAGGRVVLPGFVDAHAHPVFASARVDEFEERARGATYQEIAARGGGIQSAVNRTRAASLDELVVSGKRYANWFLRGGTTTVEAKSGYGSLARRRSENSAGN